ncbi:hypothetical protein PsYK624_153510 [Phanerochaete sordida]|uniref:Uncharacterized protein n=1 Tax=Phanerochaete sordida TaxID=48140 RepID=A0A9P3GT26_9APHY|nr:hypothetical protein PsYK624_153510 [Phanerochaete sordida]
MVFTLTNTGHVSRIVFKLWNTYSRKDLLKLPSLFSSLTKLDTHASESFVGMDTFVVEIPEDLFAELEPAVHACMPRLAAQGALEVQERRLFLPFQMMVEYWTTVEKREQGTHQAESPTEVDRDTQQATAASEDIERTPEVPAELNGSGGKNAAKERENET